MKLENPIYVPDNLILSASSKMLGYMMYHLTKHDYYLSKNQLDNGYYELSYNSIQSDLSLSKKTIQKYNESIFRAHLIDIYPTDKKGINRYKINFNRILEIMKLPYEECKLEENRIKMVENGAELTYKKNKHNQLIYEEVYSEYEKILENFKKEEEENDLMNVKSI